MKKILLTIIPLTALLAIISCDRIQRNEVKERPVPVRVARVLHEDVCKPVNCTGVLSAGEITKLSFKTGGIIDEIAVKEGQRAVNGQTLARLDLSEIRAKVGQAEVGFEKAKRDLERAQALFDDGAIPLAQLQNAHSALDIAAKDREIADFNLRHSEIRAPAEGVVLKRLAEERELIGQGMPVFIFASSEKSWVVKCGVIDRDLVRIEIGDSARIEIDAHPEAVFRGYVSKIAEIPDLNTGIFEVELILDETDFKLVTGLIAKAVIFPSKNSQTALVPVISAVRIEGKSGYIFAPNREKSIAVLVPVEFDFVSGENIGVKFGMDGISEVITEGALYLTDGSKIIIIE